MKISSYKGFNLIELLFVIGIMGIIAAIAAPNYQTYMAQRRLNGAVRQIVSDLMAARMQAVKMNRDVQVDIASSFSSQYTYDFGDAAAVTKNIQNNYRDVTVQSTISPIIFRSNGGLSTNPTITVHNSLGDKTITISIAGRVKIN
ncbi:MAG: GspH/FimT family pseudopilin [Syntrophales bacterium LBB04]|nr:GspH/FimT family pseudopilin [Syntrophales bacterium LBB04]